MFLFFMQFAQSAFVFQFQESRIQPLRYFFGQNGHRPHPPGPKVPIHPCLFGNVIVNLSHNSEVPKGLANHGGQNEVKSTVK